MHTADCAQKTGVKYILASEYKSEADMDMLDVRGELIQNPRGSDIAQIEQLGYFGMWSSTK